jgi:hypothetical protein
MQLNNRLLSIVSYLAVLVGVVLGASGIVRGGSLFIAAGTLGIALKAGNFRRIEFYLPAVIALALFALAIALPNGR